MQENAVRGDGSYPRTGREDTDQIQRVSRAQCNQLSGRFCFPNGTQQADGFRQTKLFAAYAACKMSAPNFAPRFKPTINASQLEPRSLQRFPFQQPAEYDPVTTQQNARVSLDGLLPRSGRREEARIFIPRSAFRLPR